MKLRNVAIVGFAQAPIVARDEHHTAQEILYPVIRRALADAGAERRDFDYQLAGSADYVDGRPFGFVMALDVMGAWPPAEDSHLEMDAAFAAYYAWLKIQAGECDTALVVGYGKNSEGEPDRVSNIQLDPYYQAVIGLEATSTQALQASAYMARAAVTDRDLAVAAAQSRAAGARNPFALVRQTATADELQKTPWAVEPLRQGYLPPFGDSAVCLLLAAEEKTVRFSNRPAWIQGADQRAELQTLGSRDLTRSRSAELATERALAMAGLKSAAEVDVIELCATNPAQEMILREAIGLDARGDGKPVVTPSGGALAGHPFMMTGLIRLGEAFLQLSAKAGEHQVPGAKRALAHSSQGHCLQQNLVFVLGQEKRWA
jgi:acetyl-CoA acetyltransferase